MKKTTNFFIIDNFNTIPTNLVSYCEDYIIYDSSTKEGIDSELKRAGLNFIKSPRTGHNISTYFSFFAENIDFLPDVMVLTKGHMIGRHCSKEFFERVYDNKYFTYLYEDKNVIENDSTRSFFRTMENQYVEINNTWYICSKDNPHRFFYNVNDLLKFIYKSPFIPRYLTFAPGACYIVTKEQVRKHSSNFYKRLNYISTYAMNPNYPIEAQMIERILPIIFESNYVVNDWMDCQEDDIFFQKLKIEETKVAEYDNGKKYRFFIKKSIGNKRGNL